MAMMSTEHDFGKDHVVLMTNEDAIVEPQYKLPEIDPYDNEPKGLIQESGDINWDCPCLGGMASGPCGVEFREAFSCFHYSKEEPKGSECVGAFQAMQMCLASHPSLYPMNDDTEDPMSQALQESEAETAAAQTSQDTSSETAKK